MKKQRLLLLLVLFCLSGILLINCNDEKKTDTPEPNTADSANKSIARGDYLVNKVAVCLDCHSTRDYTKFSGPIVAGTEGMGGEVFEQKNVGLPGMIVARNITPDTATGIGSWTDEEVIRAITHGIRKNGDTLFPLMPYAHYNQMAKQDVLDIVAYIRTLKPIKNAVPERKLFIPISMAYPGPILKPSLDANVKPAVDEKVKYGEYLVKMASCGECHTPRTERGQGAPFTGGFVFRFPTFTVASANITPDTATGIGAYTEDVFLNKFKNYRNADAWNYDPGKSNSIMPWTVYAHMDDFDLKAIYAYLRTIPPVKNKVEKYPVK